MKHKQQSKQKEEQHQINYDIQQNALPHVTFHKCWSCETGIMGELHLEASSHSIKEAYQTLERLVQLSNRHDLFCEARQRHSNKTESKCKTHLV